MVILEVVECLSECKVVLKAESGEVSGEMRIDG